MVDFSYQTLLVRTLAFELKEKYHLISVSQYT